MEACGDGVLSGEGLDLALDIAGAGFEVRDFGAGFVESGAQRAGDGAIGILDQGADAGNDTARALRDEDADFAEHASGGVDTSGAVCDVGAAVAVQSSQDVLIEGFYGDRMDVLVSERLEERFGVGAIGFVAHGVGTGSVRWQQVTE